MKLFKKGLRMIVLVLFLVLGSFGLGFTNILSSSKERYRDRETRREQSEKREEEETENKEKSG